MLGWWQGWWVIDRIEGNGVGACEWRGVGMLHCTALHCTALCCGALHCAGQCAVCPFNSSGRTLATSIPVKCMISSIRTP